MALYSSELAGLFVPEPMPINGTEADFRAWADRQFIRLAGFLRIPRISVLSLERIEFVDESIVKYEDGMLVYAAAGVFGPQEGLWFRELGAWKKAT
jgi:hypothetical protein